MKVTTHLPMRVKFTGYWNIPSDEVPDDRGSIDIWLLNHISQVIMNDVSETGHDDSYKTLELSWEVVG